MFISEMGSNSLTYKDLLTVIHDLGKSVISCSYLIMSIMLRLSLLSDLNNSLFDSMNSILSSLRVKTLLLVV